MSFMLEPDIIAATENVLPELNNDLVLAKNFLKQQSSASGDNLYEHLVDIVHKIISERPPDVVDNFEHYSWDVKQDKLKPNFDVLNDVYLSPPHLQTVQRLDGMFKLLASKVKKNEDAEEEEELDLEEEFSKPMVADLIEHNYYFREAGFGLAESECYSVFIALKMLAEKEPVATVRFFGKIYGTKKNYYVAETDLSLMELDRRIREFDLKDMPGEGEGNMEDLKDIDDDEDEKEIPVGGEEMKLAKPIEPVRPILPPVPVSTWSQPPLVPVERPGQGCNKMVYWVCNNLGESWICLPDVTPQQIQVARGAVHCMTGDLDAEVMTYPPFDGTERNYLRAQLSRIASATSVSPQGFYTFGSGEEEEDVDMEEGGDLDFRQNPFYHGHTLKDLQDNSFTYWVHHGRHILKQGRTIWWNTNAGMDEALEEEEEEGAAALVPETGPSLMTSLAEDARIEGMPAWSARASSTLSPERAVAVLRSNIWPGAYSYATTGKKSECIYIGWGLKYQPPNYSPPQLPKVQDEYPIGPEVLEMADPTFADEEAYRIAHLPPPPPPELPGEGGFGEEFGEQEDE